MSYLKAYIPGCEGYGFSGGPEFKTRIKVLANGRERRNADWDNERNRYTLPFLNLTPDKYLPIRQHFQVCRGMLHNFLYQDPLDDEAVNEQFALGNGVDIEFQLSKLSVTDGVFYQRVVTALYSEGPDGSAIDVTPVITVNGVVNGSVTFDRERGKVIFLSPPANLSVLRWSGAFSVWVRFDQDWLPFSLDSQNQAGYAHNGSVSLMEVPPPEEVTT
jgi:uncharacterized protein (TIGR02217 family)